MLCSVIIPLYNKENYIECAIQSVLRQQYQHFEIIVIDDGSTDAGPHLVRAIQDPRIHLIQQANSGVSSARNRGIALAKGELVCFLDADDWYLPEFLATIVAMAKKYPDIPFFATGYKRISTLSSITESVWECGVIEQDEVIDNFFSRWLLDAFFFTSSAVVRRERLNQLQPCFPPGESMGEDQDLFFRLAESGGLAYCKTPLVGYRVEVEGSLCVTYKANKLLPVYLRLEQRALRRQMPDPLRYSALKLVTKAKTNVARNALMDGRRHDACMCLLEDMWRGIRSIKWWVTAVMCVFFTPSYVKRWVNWRSNQAQLGKYTD